MNYFLAHGGEDHDTSADSLTHQLTDEPIVGLLVICAGVCLLAAVLVMVLGKSRQQKAHSKHKKSDAISAKPDRDDS